MTFESAPKWANFWPALAISLVLHGLVFWSAPPETPVGETVRPLEATLRPAVAPAAVSYPRQASDPGESRPGPPSRHETPARPKAVAAPESAAVLRQDALPMPAPSPTADSAPHPAPASVPVPVPVPVPGESARPQPAAVPEGLAGDDLRQYRLSLAAQARRFKLYPARAMEGRMSGTAEVQLTVGASGFPQNVRLVKSSGYELLDETAIDMVRKAAPRTHIPEPLRGRPFAVSLPVVFDLTAE